MIEIDAGPYEVRACLEDTTPRIAAWLHSVLGKQASCHGAQDLRLPTAG